MQSKQLIKQFYATNKINFAVIMTARLLNVASTLFLSLLLQWITDVAASGGMDDLIKILYFVIALVCVLALIVSLNVFVFPKYKEKAARQYKNYVYNNLLKLDIVQFNKDGASEYISALTNDLNTIESNYIENIFGLIENILIFTGAITLMLYSNALLTAVGVGLSLIPFILSLVAGGKLGKKEKDVSDENGRFVHFVNDTLSGFFVIKNFRIEDKIGALFRKNNAKAERVKANKNRGYIFLQEFCGLLGVVVQIVVFVFGTYLCITSPDKMSVGTIILFVQLMNFVINPIVSVPQSIAARKACKPLINKVAGMLSGSDGGKQKTLPAHVDSAITLDDMRFAYGDGENAIDGISYTFEKNRSYAVVGSSGSGKTTLFNILMGTYDNYEGSVRYDGCELRNIAVESLYDCITLVSQNIFIFDDTVKNNITMYSPADNTDIQNAVEHAALGDFVAEKGMDYGCGINGCNLSGGQKQRISIARGFLKRAPLLLMDEATSALDAETAARINAQILALPDTTKIVITHRLDESTLKRFDRILFMKNGKIAEEGTFAELIEKDALFASMYKLAQ